MGWNTFRSWLWNQCAFNLRAEAHKASPATRFFKYLPRCDQEHKARKHHHRHHSISRIKQLVKPPIATQASGVSVRAAGLGTGTSMLQGWYQDSHSMGTVESRRQAAANGDVTSHALLPTRYQRESSLGTRLKCKPEFPRVLGVIALISEAPRLAQHGSG